MGRQVLCPALQGKLSGGHWPCTAEEHGVATAVQEPHAAHRPGAIASLAAQLRPPLRREYALGSGAPGRRSCSLLCELITSLDAARDGLKYNKSHEWAKVDGDIATVGLSDFAQVQCWQTGHDLAAWAAAQGHGGRHSPRAG